MTSTTTKISPSVLACDLAKIGEECEKLVDSGCDWLHFDIMDGHFCPNITFGPKFVESSRNFLESRGKSSFFDCHMMVEKPVDWIVPMKFAGADLFTFHVEAFQNSEETLKCIETIRKNGLKVGITLNPETKIERILEILTHVSVDLVLVMTVKPGFCGQKFTPECLEKVKILRRKYRNLDIEVDGGVSPDNVDECSKAGCNVFVAGNAICKSPNWKETMNEMRRLSGHVYFCISVL